MFSAKNDDCISDNVDPASSTPVYKQIYTSLKRRLLRGDYNETEFPSAREICETFGVSRISARHALDKLAREGLISMGKGRKTTVHPQASAPLIKADFEGLLHYLEMQGDATTVELLNTETMGATDQLAEVLACSSDDPITKTSRRRLLRDMPFSYIFTFMRHEISQRFSDETPPSAFSVELFRDHGIQLQGARQSITACSADDEVAKFLQVSHGAPVLKICRTFLAQSESPIVYTVGFYRPDLYVYEMEMSGIVDDQMAWDR